MYTQGLDAAGREAAPPDEAGDDAREARFQARIDAEEKIEPKDWMPEAYRRTLIRQIAGDRGQRSTTQCFACVIISVSCR